MMLNKTLTFGLGRICGVDNKTGEFYYLQDEQQKKIYGHIRQGFRDFAKVCNYYASLFYTTRILNVTLENIGFNKGYVPIIEKLGIDTPLNGKILNQAYGLVNAHFTGEHGKKLMGSGESVLPTHRADGTHPLCFHKNTVKLKKIDSSFFIVYHLFAKKWAEQENLPQWIAFEIKIKRRDKTGESQLDRILSGEWKTGSGQLVRNKRDRGNKYIMHLVVTYEPDPFKTISETVIMGVDQGVTTPAAIHFRTNGEPEKWAMLIGDGKMLLNARAIVRSDIIRHLRGLKRKDSPLQGHAREAALERLKELRKREQRIMKTASQKIAASIAEQAKRNGAGIWQIENITGSIKEGKPWLAKNWAPGMLMDALRWQAKQIGAEIRLIDPRYTSQRCSKCGHIDTGNRPKGKMKASYFKCTACGYTDHADKNAARNISVEGIESIINETMQNKVPNGTVNGSR